MKRGRSDYPISVCEKLEEAKQEIRKAALDEYAASEQFLLDVQIEGNKEFTRLVNSKKDFDDLKEKLRNEVNQQAKDKVDKEFKEEAERTVKTFEPVEKLTPATRTLPPAVYERNPPSK